MVFIYYEQNTNKTRRYQLINTYFRDLIEGQLPYTQTAFGKLLYFQNIF